MLNIVQLIADIVEEVNTFKKDNLDTLQKTYEEKMAKVIAVEKQISDIPKTCKGKSEAYVNNKRKQLYDKLDKLTKSVDEWYAEQRKRILDKVEEMLTSKKKSAQEAADNEKKQEDVSKETADDMCK